MVVVVVVGVVVTVVVVVVVLVVVMREREVYGCRQEQIHEDCEVEQGSIGSRGRRNRGVRQRWKPHSTYTPGRPHETTNRERGGERDRGRNKGVMPHPGRPKGSHHCTAET